MTSPRPEDVFARHHRDIYRYLVHMAGSRDAADDLQQEVFLRVVRALRNGGPIGHERGWIFSIARNLVLDRRRTELRRGVSAGNEEPLTEATQPLAFGLDQALAALPAHDREVFLMREVGGLRYDEIAAACGASVESVRSRLARTRRHLRLLLAPLR